MLSTRYVIRAALATAALVVIGLFTTAAGASAATPTLKAAQASADQKAGEYAGQDTCLVCHENRNYKGTLHSLTSNPRTPASNKGCESCHGPGKAHADAGGGKGIGGIVNPLNLKPQAASEICLGCHNRGTHALWSGSQHDQRNVGCITCHSVHSPKGPVQIKAASQIELCATCHKNITNKQSRFNHMPVREGKISCSSCHNPHGSQNLRLLKTGTTIDESCASCHPEKRGPYLWEHAPVSNACVTCHDPHGSNNERMLVAKVPYLCQRCHVTSRHPPTVYEGFVLQNSTNGNKIYGRGCVVCHQQIHGSNAPSGQMFLR